MGLLDKAKAAAEQAAAKAKEGVEDVQQKRELGQAYGELGKTAFELIESGEISHPRLEDAAARIRTLNAEKADAAPASTDDGHDPEQPPAVPT
jgi:hypothetical protein